MSNGPAVRLIANTKLYRKLVWANVVEKLQIPILIISCGIKIINTKLNHMNRFLIITKIQFTVLKTDSTQIHLAQQHNWFCKLLTYLSLGNKLYS